VIVLRLARTDFPVGDSAELPSATGLQFPHVRTAEAERSPRFPGEIFGAGIHHSCFSLARILPGKAARLLAAHEVAVSCRTDLRRGRRILADAAHGVSRL